MAWVGERLGLVLGSEDGNALTSKPLMFAHGIQSWGFGWQDASMRKQAKSPYYLGKWWPDEAPQVSAEVISQLSAPDFPHVARVIGHVMASGRHEDFTFGLDLILDALERRLAGST